MPIDPKTIEAWKSAWRDIEAWAAYAQQGDAGACRVMDAKMAALASEAFPRLLAERKEITAALGPLVADLGQPLPEMVRNAVAWGMARDKAREEAVALLREVEWQGMEWDGETYSRACPVCGNDAYIQALHAPDCRLAAFLGAN